MFLDTTRKFSLVFLECDFGKVERRGDAAPLVKLFGWLNTKVGWDLSCTSHSHPVTWALWLWHLNGWINRRSTEVKFAQWHMLGPEWQDLFLPALRIGSLVLWCHRISQMLQNAKLFSFWGRKFEIQFRQINDKWFRFFGLTFSSFWHGCRPLAPPLPTPGGPGRGCLVFGLTPLSWGVSWPGCGAWRPFYLEPSLLQHLKRSQLALKYMHMEM